jgi:Flp pilus assembly CpaF family ATPase
MTADTETQRAAANKKAREDQKAAQARFLAMRALRKETNKSARAALKAKTATLIAGGGGNG